MNFDLSKLEKIGKVSEEEEVNIEKIYQECLIDLSEEMPKPDILLSIGEHKYKNSYYPTSICTAGEVSCIAAESKAKKTFLKSALIAAYIGGNANNYFPNIKTHRKENFTVLDFDTEQSNYYAQRTFRRVAEMNGNKYDGYYPYATRHLTSNERLLLLDYCLKTQSKLYKTKVSLVVIDGIADLIENTNDIVLSKQIADYLMKWTYDYKIHILIIIHKSGITNKPLGHMGTYVIKKVETLFDLTKENDGTIKVCNPYSRGYKFEEFRFDVNEDALPFLIED